MVNCDTLIGLKINRSLFPLSGPRGRQGPRALALHPLGGTAVAAAVVGRRVGRRRGRRLLSGRGKAEARRGARGHSSEGQGGSDNLQS